MTRSCPFKAPLSRPAGIPESFINRREWIRKFAVGTAVALGGGGLRQSLLSEISPGAEPANIVNIKLTDYPTLQSAYGSVRFNLFGAAIPNGIITVTRAPGNVFYAVSAYCTHASCIVDPYDHSPGTEAMVCYCHGSVYDIQGQVITGQVLNQADLPAYNTSLNGDVVRVEIPNLNVRVNSVETAPPVSGNPRFKLVFPVRQNGKYRILYTPDLNTAPTQVNFSNTATGAMSQVQFNSSSNTIKNVWVQNSATLGFYMVEMIVTEYVP